MANRQYLLVIERTESGFRGYSPDVPECSAVGSTPTETEERYRDALEMYFARLVANGQPLPVPKSRATYVTV
jgi:predicted RNase H-like HicB family nuclease